MKDKLESMSIEITKKCNLRCKFCYASSNKKVNEEEYIDDDKIDRVIKEIKKNNLTKVTITGGEPLMNHELFLKMIKKLHDNNITINLNTNVSMMTDDIAKEIKKYIGKEFYVFTSLLSANPDTCDQVTGIKGSYTNILNGIKCCKSNGLKISVNFTISKENVNDLSLIEKFVDENKIDRVSISRVIPPSYDRSSEQNRLSGEQIKLIADTLITLNDKFKISIASSHPLPLCIIGEDKKYDLIESMMCRAGSNHCALNLSTGNIFACSQEGKNYGNIYTDPLYKCWLKMEMEHGIHNLAKKCQNCDLLNRCGGECRWSECTIC